MDLPIDIDRKALGAFCEKWDISELELFGSVLREDFGPDSDVDVLVRFHPGIVHSLFAWTRMRRELMAIFGRSVDLVSRDVIERSRNPYRKRAILENARVLYAA